MIRKIDKISASKPTIEGAGVHLKRAFGYYEAPQLDPFLLLDDFRSNNPEDYIAGFPWHPHRGIETVTKGINGRMGGFQLWVNLPSSHKMMEPRYREVTNEQIQEVSIDKGVTIRVISGEVNKKRGPVKDIVVDIEYLDVTMGSGTEFEHSIKKGYRAFAYVIEGSGYFDSEKRRSIGKEHLVIFKDRENVKITADDKNLRFLLISGRPIGEPVAWYGPIVMNTQEELEIAFEEYQNGTFIKHKI
jgi:redox-sensitive bicupin YhaK (pirin superfamily)